MAGEFALQFNPRAFSDPSLIHGSNPAFDINAGNFAIVNNSFPTTNSDMAARQFRLAFQDTKSESVPHQHKNIVTDNNVGKKLDLSI